MKEKLRVHYFQHIAGEGFGSCYDYFKQHDAQISATEFFALPTALNIDIEALPEVEQVDLLMIMGGAMSVNDEINFPWLKLEKRWLRRYLAAGKPAIGLCLGAQLIASALGATISRNVQPEFGWRSVYKSPSEKIDSFVMPEECLVLQWHHETFQLPKGAILLAENEVCRNQLFQLGKNVLGFQFHPEMTLETLQLFLENEEGTGLYYGAKVCEKNNVKDNAYQLVKQGNLLLNQAIEYVLRT